MNIPESDIYKWIPKDDGNDLLYQPPFDSSAFVQHYHIMTEQGARDAIDLTIRDYGKVKIRPDVGVLTMYQRRLAMPGDIIAHHIPGEEAVIRKMQQDAQMMLKCEKAAIARRLKERQRKRELEKIVTQELIDNGELFGEQPKRPPIPREVVDAVYKRDGGRCVYCGSTENLQLDHIIPFSKGGATTIENLQLLCQKCNLEKSNHIG
jgi:hypothetical protein